MVTIRRRGVELRLDAKAVLRSREVAEALDAVAERMAAAARASAPVESGEYRASIRVESDPSRERARVRVVADSPHAVLVESRTGNLKRAAGRA